MNLLEIVVLCLLAWGGVAGYFSGWKKMVYYLFSFLVTAAAAAAFQADLMALLSKKVAVKEHLAAIINRKLAVPVEAAFGNTQITAVNLEIPKAILSNSPLAASADLSNLPDLMAQVTTNAVSFFLLLLLWIGFFNLLAFIRSADRLPERSLERWAGALLGVLRQALVTGLIIGISAPLIWLMDLPSALLDFENSSLFYWCLQLGRASGAWW
jgi:uncharacterized membrane protein required for colicin V production